MYFSFVLRLFEPMGKTCIIISPYFPPSSLAGVHRARHLAKHLPAAGWTPIVLCVDEAYHEERLDPALARLVPAATEVVKVAALSPRLTRLLGLGEISLRSFVPLRRTLFRLLATRHVDVVLITGSPFYPMLLAAEVKQRFGVPVILDFQDPWVSAWGATQPRLSKTGLSHMLATVLEPRALRGASFVTSVSDTQNAQMAERYPWLDRERMAAVPIGSDPDDFEVLRYMPQGKRGVELNLGQINISYVGTFMPRTAPLMKVILRAVVRLRASHPELVKRLRLNFIGTSNQPNEFERLQVKPLAEAAGVTEVVNEVPQRIPYLDALTVLAKSDGILMIGSDELHYTASKIYPGLMSGRPFLSVFHRSSSAHQILSSTGGGVALAFSTEEELTALEGAICDGLYRLAVEPKALGKADTAVYMPYEARAIAHRYAEIFEKLAREREKL